jgi:hypothetical protein
MEGMCSALMSTAVIGHCNQHVISAKDSERES